MSQSTIHLQLVPRTWPWVQCTSVASPVTRSESSRAPFEMWENNRISDTDSVVLGSFVSGKIWILVPIPSVPHCLLGAFYTFLMLSPSMRSWLVTWTEAAHGLDMLNFSNTTFTLCLFFLNSSLKLVCLFVLWSLSQIRDIGLYCEV